MILAVATMTILIVSGVAANSQQMQGEMPQGKRPQHQHGMMERKGSND
jgi:hypothetical protein